MAAVLILGAAPTAAQESGLAPRPARVGADSGVSAASGETAVARAREEFFVAEAYYRKGDYRQAIAHYQRAYAASPHPAVLYNIGECYELLREHEQAHGYYTRYLTEAPGARDRPRLAARMERLRRFPCPVSISSTPADAQVTINGQPRGVTPLQVALAPGTYAIAARHEDRAVQERHLECSFGRPHLVAFSFDARIGRLSIHTSLEGAVVRLDGQVVGHTPYDAQVPPGRHQVELTLYGHAPERRQVVVAAGEVTRLIVRLRRPDAADQLDLRRDGPNPFVLRSPVAAPARPAKVPSAGAPPGRWSFGVGGLGGGHLSPDRGDQRTLGGLVLALLAPHRKLEVTMEVLLPSPVIIDWALRVGPRAGSVWFPFKLGMLVAVNEATPPATELYTGFGFSLGAGLAVDLGQHVTLYAQIGLNLVLPVDSPGPEDSTTVQVPLVGGVIIRL